MAHQSRMGESDAVTTRLVLAGAGHAHLSVLQALARKRPSETDIVLVTPAAFQTYSGMLPGWIAGHYSTPQCRIDVHAFAHQAGVRVVEAYLVAMDADRQCVATSDGQRIDFDILSLDVGSEIDRSLLEMAGARLLALKPLDDFFQAWPEVLAAALHKPGYRLAVVGAGAAGVELALAARHAFMRAGAAARVDLVASGAGPVAGHGRAVQRRVTQALDRAGVVVHHVRAAGAKEGLVLSDGTILACDCVIAATGARAPAWLGSSKLALDENGFVAVDGCHRSVSHPCVFAAGDVCARQDREVGRSGVHAVRAGPVLAANLLAMLQGGAMGVYRPRRRSLYLLACGPRYAIASWGRWSAEGYVLWRWKDWIDRRFIARFAPPAPRTTVGTKALLRRAGSARIARAALRIALVVGTALNIINQGPALWAGDRMHWGHFLLNYLIPYCVASYSAANNEIARRKDE